MNRWTRWTLLWVGLIVAGSVAGIVLPAGIGWDFGNFYDAGRKVLAGELANLYVPGVPIGGEPPTVPIRFWGTPLSAFAYAPFAALPPYAALVAFKLATAAALFASLLLIHGDASRFLPPDFPRARFTAWFAFAALVFQPLWTVYRVGGQTTPWVLLLVALALRFMTREQYGRAAAALVIGVAIKPAFAPALALLFLISGRRFALATLGAGVAAAGLSVLIAGWPLHAEFIDLMRRGATTQFSPWYYNSAPAILVNDYPLLADPPAESLYRAAGMLLRVALLAGFGWVLYRIHATRLPAPSRRHLQLLVAFCFSLLIARVSWEHYLMLLFPLLAVLIAAAPSLPRGAVRLVTGIVAFGAFQNIVLINFVRSSWSPGSALELLAIGLIKSAPLLLTFVLLVRYADTLAALWRPVAAPASRREPGRIGLEPVARA